MSECSSCGAKIIWALTEGGKRMPLDAKPVTMFALPTKRQAEGAGIAPTAVSITVYQTHFASCPNAAEHRKRP